MEERKHGKISHEKWLDSPPPASPGKCLMLVHAGRLAMSTHKSLDSSVGQESKCPCRLDTLVQPMFCSKTHKWSFLFLHRCNIFKSWWWLQCSGQIKLRYTFTFVWGSCKCLSSIVLESNALIWPQNTSQENSLGAQDLNKHLPPSCISRLTLRWRKTCWISFVSSSLNKDNLHTLGIYLSCLHKDFCSGWGNGRERSTMTCLFSTRTVISFCQQEKQKIFVSVHVYQASNQAAWGPIFRDGTQGCLL